MASRKHLDNLEEIASLRAELRAQGRSIPQIVEAIVDRFGVSRLKAHRLARGWTRPQAVERILATYDADGLARPKLTPQRLCAWEHDPKVRPGEDYLDRLCRVYETRPDQLGYGHDYTPAMDLTTSTPTSQKATTATGDGDEESHAAYAGASPAPLAPMAGQYHDADHDAQAEDQEADTNRTRFLQAVGATGLAALVDQAGQAAIQLSSKLGSSNLGPVTIEQLELRVASFTQNWEAKTPNQLFRAVFAQQQQVEALLDGHQPLDQRRALHRIAGQLAALLAGLSFDLGDYNAAYAHCLTALQLGEQVGDHCLIASARKVQATVALWDNNPRMALHYAQDGQRYVTGAGRAQLAARCEARAYARMTNPSGVKDALRRAEHAMPSQPANDDPDAAWWLFSPAALELYTGISLLWLGRAKQAEPHARQAITCYETQPPLLQSPANHAQAQITLATCLADQNQPDEALQLATESLTAYRGSIEPNLQQASQFLATLKLKPEHHKLTAARQFAEQLQSLRNPRSALNPG
jgi:tetratricopeptide (TPR) repeat protein